MEKKRKQKTPFIPTGPNTVLTSGSIQSVSMYKAEIIGVVVANILLIGAPWFLTWLLSLNPGPGYDYMMYYVMLPMSYVGGAINLMIVLMIMPRTFARWHPNTIFLILGTFSIVISIMYAIFCVAIYLSWLAPPRA